MSQLFIVQQFGGKAGDSLRSRFSASRVLDTESGPAGWHPDADVLLAGPTRAWRDAQRPTGWPGRLRWIQLASAGIDGYPAWIFEVTSVTAAPALNAPAIAEFILALMLAHEKQLPQSWIHSADQWCPRSLGTLNGRVLGLAGIGAIGGAVARHALAFGMHVTALRRNKGRLVDGISFVDNALSLAAKSDHLVLCLPSTPETRNLVNERFLEACKPNLHLVNVARGDLIDQVALIRALDEGKIAAASLDVASPEPLPQAHDFYTHPQVRLSPHVAWNSPDTIPRLLDLFISQLEQFSAAARSPTRFLPPVLPQWLPEPYIPELAMQSNQIPPKYPLAIPAPLEDLEAENFRRRQELVIACRLLASLRLDWGTAGHITVRDALTPDHFWVNAYGRHFGTLTVDDLLQVDGQGRVVSGTGILNPASFAVHAAIHEARPEVLAAAHGHPTYGKAWASLGRQLDPISQDACAFYDDHAVLEIYSGIVLSEDEGQLITRTLGKRKALLLQNHGLLTVGETLESCIFWFIAFDNACQVQLLAEAAGEPRLLPEDVAHRTARAIGREEVGYFGYQNLKQQFLAVQAEAEQLR